MDFPESPFDLEAVSIPDKLLNGTRYTSWDEENISLNNIFFVDKYGFFLYWRTQDDKEGNCIDLNTVSEVRSGFIPKDTKVREVLLRSGKDPLENRMLTVVYNTSLIDVSFLHLCASSMWDAKEWIEGLHPLLYNYKINNVNIMTQLFKQYVKACILSNTPGTISVKGICKALNAGKLELNVLNGLRDLGLSSGKNDEMLMEDMSFENFYQLYLKVCPRLEIDQLCVKWGGGRAPYLTVQQLVKFLNEEQRDPRLNEILYPYYDKEKALKIIRKYEKSMDMLQRDRISVNGLTRYLLSEDTELLKADKLQLTQDMNQPLSCYFINSSHNTYLIGRQFGGKSSVEMYRQCLIAGCRCIELDCWDGPNDEPLITHGNAMCTKISFKDVIEAIRDSAFVTSDYPVLLSFENHCSKQQQYKMASYCVDILGDALVTKALDSWPLEEGRPLPSPNQLRGRILIKNKKLKPEQEAEGETSYDFTDLESMCATLRRDSGSLKETAIVDDNVETVKDDTKETIEQRNSQSSNDDFHNGDEKRLSQVELSDLLQFSSKVTSDIIEKAANVVREKSKRTKRQCHTVSEYSYLLKKMEDPNVQNGLDNLDSALNHLQEVDVNNFAMSDYYDKVSNCSCSDCEGEDDINNSMKETTYCVKCSHYVIRERTASNISNSSIDSDISLSGSESDSANNNIGVTVVIDKDHAPCFNDEKIDDVTPTPSPHPSPAATPTRDFTADPVSLFTGCSSQANGNLSTSVTSTFITSNSFTSKKESNGQTLIQSFSSSTSTSIISSSVTSSSVTHNQGSRTSSTSSSTSQNSQTTISESVNGERKDSNTSMTSDMVTTRKESITSSTSIDSNCDEDEERDVVGHLMYKQDKNFGSSLRLNMMPKKGSRSASLTPEEFELISSFQSQASTTAGNINPFLSSLVNYIQPVPFQGFEEAEEKNVSYQMSSFNESTGFQLVKTSPSDFVKYNKRQLSRIYPRGSRVDSSNYNPQVFWNVGCQMVSLNFQTPDLAYQLNQGKFEMNGSCGYLLKPDLMVRKDRTFDPFTESVIDGCVAAYVAVKVISGQFLSDKKITTLVEVDLYGLPTDTIRKKYKTKMATSKGLNTVYEEEEFVFRRVVMPQVALLRFGVVDDNDKLLAQRIVPLNALQAGYRHIPLRTETGYGIPLGTLFVHITLKSYVPEGYSDIVDELSEPIKYRSAAEKRASQMVMFEVLDDNDDTDLPSFIKKSNSDNALSKMKSSSISLTSLTSTSSSASLPPFNNRPRESIVTLSYMGARSGSELAIHLMESNVPKKFEIKHAPISQEELKKEKTYRKALKRHQKEIETLQKKYTKERNAMQKMHTYQLEQLITAFEENKQAAYKNYERAARRCGEEKTAALKVYEKKILYQSQLQRDEANKTLSAQTKEWTAMIDKQIIEEMEMHERHSETQTMLLKAAMKEIHDVQMKELKIKHERENAEIKKKQTKQSIEQIKLLLADKTVKSKEERDRKQRELDRQNLKQFVEERKKLESRQAKELEDMQKRHDEEQLNLEQEMKKAIADKIEDIKGKGENLRKAIRSPYQTLLPAH